MNTKLILTQRAYQQLKYFTQISPHEISGIGKSQLIENKDKEIEEIIVTDIIIFKQECSASGTVIEEGCQEEFFLELAKKKDPTRKDWNIWWHSHATMEVFWSGIDETTISDHIGLQPFLISLVTNKKNEYEARLDVFPKDTSAFKKGTYTKYELDVEIEEKENIKTFEKERKHIEKAMEVIEEKKDAAVEKFDEALEQAETKLSEIEDLEEGDPKIQKQCAKEVKDKVNEKKFNTYDWRKSDTGKKWKRKKWNWEDEDDDDDEFLEPEKKRTKLISKKFRSNQKSLLPYDDPFYINDDPTWEDFEKMHEQNSLIKL